MPLTYEINTRCWLRELSAKSSEAITLANVPDAEFDEWQRLAFTHIWLMGVWTSGPRSRAVALDVPDLQQAYGSSRLQVRESDISGSPYAIAEYQVPDELGGEAGLRKFRQKLHRYGMNLLLDFVPNHLGLDHRWLKERPNLFVQSATEQPGFFAQQTNEGPRWIAHGRDPYFAPWSDTAQLDYRQCATRAAMQEQLLSVAERCDGLRCDMAMLILNDVFAKTWDGFPPLVRNEVNDSPTEKGSEPNAISCEMTAEFWSEAIEATKRIHPTFLFIAEVYWGLETRLQSLGFDYTYNKEVYDEVIRHHAPGVQEKLLHAAPAYLAASVFFLENHDEPRIASLLPFAEHRAAATLLLALPGMRLLHEGQLSGGRFRNPVQLNRRVPEGEDRDVRGLYEEIIATFRDTPVGEGECAVLEPVPADDHTARNLVLLRWNAPSADTVLVAINLSPDRSRCHLPEAFIGLNGGELEIDLQAYETKLLW